MRLTREPIDPAVLTASVRRDHCGAVVTFLGTVRDVTGDDRTAALDYEAYADMAERVLADIEAEVRNRWPVGGIGIVHRLGMLPAGEISVGVAVSCPHRAEAFAACQYAIDRVKELAPIWKRDVPPAGPAKWVGES